MTKAQEQHLAEVKARISSLIESKYRRGQAKHGGNVWERNSITDMEEEITDMVVYFHCIKDSVAILRTELDAWHEAFGTTQLSHAVARLEFAERSAARAK